MPLRQCRLVTVAPITFGFEEGQVACKLEIPIGPRTAAVKAETMALVERAIQISLGMVKL